MLDEWYFQKHGHFMGPYTRQQLRRLIEIGEVGAETQLQHDGALVLAGEVRGLFPNAASSLRSAIYPETAPKMWAAPFVTGVEGEGVPLSTDPNDSASHTLDAALPAWLAARRSLSAQSASPESPPEMAGLNFDTWPPPALTPIDAVLSDLSDAPPRFGSTPTIEERLVPAPPKGVILTRHEFSADPPPLAPPAADAAADTVMADNPEEETLHWEWTARWSQSSTRRLVVAAVAILLLIPSVAWWSGRAIYPDDRVAKLTVEELASRITDRSFAREEFFRKFGGPKRASTTEASLIFTFTCRDGDAEVAIASEPFQTNGVVQVRSCTKS